MEEIWKDIKGYEGKYQVSNLGRVRSLDYLRTGKIQVLKPRNSGKNYFKIMLSKNDKSNSYFIHRLVAQAFVPNDNPEHKTQCYHINEIHTDNRACNLNWMTPNSIRNIKPRNSGKKPKPVVQMTLDGTIVKIWPSINEAVRNGFNLGNIVLCCQNKRNTHKGFRWEYTDFGRMFWYLKRKMFKFVAEAKVIG